MQNLIEQLDVTKEEEIELLKKHIDELLAIYYSASIDTQLRKELLAVIKACRAQLNNINA